MKLKTNLHVPVKGAWRDTYICPECGAGRGEGWSMRSLAEHILEEHPKTAKMADRQCQSGSQPHENKGS